MPVMLCTVAKFAKKNSGLVARIVPYYTAGLHLLTFHLLGHTLPKILHLVSVTLSHINGIIIVHLSLN